MPCPKEHTTFPDQLPEIVSEHSKSKVSICFYGNLSLTRGASCYSNQQTLTRPDHESGESGEK